MIHFRSTRIPACLVLILSVGLLAGCGKREATSSEPAAPPVDRAAPGKPVHVDADSFEAEVLKADGVVVVDFWADWCGPCKMIAPTLEKLAGEYQGRIKIAKLDVDENKPLAEQYKIRGIPALLAFKGGEVVDSKVGAMPEREFREWFDGLL